MSKTQAETKNKSVQTKTLLLLICLIEKEKTTTKMVWQTWIYSEVLYDSDDKLSFLLALISLAPIALIFILAVLSALPTVLARNSARFLIILLLAEAVNQLLKRIIRQNRPMPHWYPQEVISSRAKHLGYGMPSSHTQMIFTAAMTSFLLPMKSAPNRYRMFRYGQWVLAVLVGYSRVYNGYHTLQQVIVGAIVGCACAYYFVKIKWIKTAAELLTQGLQQLTSL